MSTSLKADYNGKHWFNKTGQRVFQYMVTGTAKDKAAYVTARANMTNRRGQKIYESEADVPHDEAGNPLFTVIQYADTTIKQHYNLDISYSGKVVIDDGDEQMARTQEVDQLSKLEEAKMRASRKYTRNVATTPVTTPIAAPKGDDVFGEETPTEEQTLQQLAGGAPVGTETLSEV